MVPGSPESGLRAESCEGSNQVDGLPASSWPGDVTAVIDNINVVRPIVDQCLGPRDPRAAALAKDDLGGSTDNMSVTSASKKRDWDRASLSDSELENYQPRVHKVLRSRVIGPEIEASNEGPIVISDSPDDGGPREEKNQNGEDGGMELF